MRSFVLAAGLAVLAGPAFAFPAVTTIRAGFLTGPGTDYDTLGTLPSGAHVDVIWCGTHKNWCLVQIYKTLGWLPQANIVAKTYKGFAMIDNSNGGAGGPAAAGGKGGGEKAGQQPESTAQPPQGGGNTPIGEVHVPSPYMTPVH